MPRTATTRNGPSPHAHSAKTEKLCSKSLCNWVQQITRKETRRTKLGVRCGPEEKPNNEHRKSQRSQQGGKTLLCSSCQGGRFSEWLFHVRNIYEPDISKLVSLHTELPKEKKKKSFSQATGTDRRAIVFQQNRILYYCFKSRQRDLDKFF